MGGFLSIFFLKIPVWLVCYAHGFYLPVYVEWINSFCGFVGVLCRCVCIYGSL